jgi:hypothetical protein
MTLAWIIYLIETLDISRGLGFLGAIGVIAWVIGLIFSIEANLAISNKTARNPERSPDSSDGYLKIYHQLWPLKLLVCVMLTLAVLLPTKETAYTMLAAYGVESIVTNDKVQEFGGKSLDVINKAMDNYLQQSDVKETK